MRKSLLFFFLGIGGLAALLTIRSVAGKKSDGAGRVTRIPPASLIPARAPSAPPQAAAAEPAAPKTRAFEGLERQLADTEARPGEVVLTFKSAEAYRRFLARARAAGVRIIAQMDKLLSVRVGFDSFEALQNELGRNTDDYASAGANFIVRIPKVPAVDKASTDSLTPLGNRLLAFLGVPGGKPQWGLGVTIAVLDSGVAPDATFGTGRLRIIDVGLGTAPGSGTEDGHGTAVAALAAGQAPDAPGIAPAAGVLSIRVTGADGTSDAFSLAQAILAAVDSGARILNVSLGAYESSTILSLALEQATAAGAVIVAAAGNDRATQLTWPAADSRTISVGSVDALEEQATFSNSGPQLKIVAPGYGVQTAWLDGKRVQMSGTSASAPIVAGAIAALMSDAPGLSPTAAWEIILQHANDGGAPGTDPDYGGGILNLGWAVNRNDSNRIDTAVSSHYYDPTSEMMEFVVQNRSGRGVDGLVLTVDADGTASDYAVPYLAAGASYVVRTRFDRSRLLSAGRIEFLSVLKNPDGLVDQVPDNNRRASYIARGETGL